MKRSASARRRREGDGFDVGPNRVGLNTLKVLPAAAMSDARN